MLAVAAAACWLGFLRLPGARELVLGILGWGLAVSALFLGAMALGALGFGLFALFGWSIGGARASARKPKPVDDWWS